MDAEMLRTLERERERGFQLFAAAGTPDELDRAQTAVLGRKAPFSEVQRALGKLSEDERRDDVRQGRQHRPC